MMEEEKEFEGYAILELMGHRKLAGYVKWTQGPLLRIDVPGEIHEVPCQKCGKNFAWHDDALRPTASLEHSFVPGWFATQFYGPAAIYCITPTTEDLARRVAKGCRPEPVSRWELPALPEPVCDDRKDEAVDGRLRSGACGSGAGALAPTPGS